jgi:hypothetical protein
MGLQIYKFKKPLFQDEEEIDSDKTFQNLEGIAGWRQKNSWWGSNIDVTE